MLWNHVPFKNNSSSSLKMYLKSFTTETESILKIYVHKDWEFDNQLNL